MKQTCLYRPGIGAAPDCGLRDDYERALIDLDAARAEAVRLRGALRDYANPDNWEYDTEWALSLYGWTHARVALGEEGRSRTACEHGVANCGADDPHEPEDCYDRGEEG